jgi:hypothetical protein
MHRRRIALSLLLSLASLSLSPSVAQADEPSASPSPPLSEPAPAGAPVDRRWYGWQPLMVDAGSIATMIGGGFARGPASGPIEILGAAGALLGSPLIHLGHEHLGKAGASLALRVLLPTAGMFTGLLIGMAAAPQNPNGDLGTGIARADVALFGGVVGAMSGGLAAIVIDDGVLAREDVRPAPPPDSRPTFEPRISSVRGGATVGVGGTF